MNKLKIASVFFALQYGVFLICQFIYKRNISDDTFETALYYLIIATFTFAITAFMRKRLFRWLVIFLVFIVPVSYFVLISYSDNYEFTPLYLLQTMFPINIPILPDEPWHYFGEIPPQNNFYYYFFFFVLPVFYWYGLYRLAKWLVKYEKAIREKAN